MKGINIISICLIIFLFSCEKKKETVIEKPVLVTTELKSGLPENTRAINGYLYASLENFGSGYSLRGYSAFRDPAGNLSSGYNHYQNNTTFAEASSGNVSVGTLSINNLTINPTSFGTTLFYTLNNTQTFTGTPVARWKTTGNLSFKPLDVNLDRGFPVIYIAPAMMFSLSKSNGYTVNFTNFISNFDSVSVRIDQFNKVVEKKAIAGETSVYFSSSDLSPLSTSSQISFYAFNYSNKTIENKVYLFELRSKLQAGITIYP